MDSQDAKLYKAILDQTVQAYQDLFNQLVSSYHYSMQANDPSQDNWFKVMSTAVELKDALSIYSSAEMVEPNQHLDAITFDVEAALDNLIKTTPAEFTIDDIKNTFAQYLGDPDCLSDVSPSALQMLSEVVSELYNENMTF